MAVTREQELWALALKVEADRGKSARGYIAEQIERFERQGENGGADLWRQIALRHAELEPEPTLKPQ